MGIPVMSGTQWQASTSGKSTIVQSELASWWYVIKRRWDKKCRMPFHRNLKCLLGYWLMLLVQMKKKKCSSGKAWCFKVQNKVNFAVLTGWTVEGGNGLFDSVCYQVPACQRAEKHHPSATKVSLKVLVMLLQGTGQLFQERTLSVLSVYCS